MQKQENKVPVPGAASPAPQAPKNSNKTLFIILAVSAGLLVIFLVLGFIVGIVLLKKTKSKLDAKLKENQTALENYKPIPDSGYSSDTTHNSWAQKQGAAKNQRYPYDASYLENSIYYWNCKYEYSLSYPRGWTIDDQTHNALQAFIHGPGVTVKLESIARTSGETLQQLAARRTEEGKISPDTAGVNIFSQIIDWNGIQVFETDFTNPDAIVLHWLQGGRAMEMTIFGQSFNTHFTSIEKMLSTLEITRNAIPLCQTSSASQKSSSSSAFDCNSWVHPNGDLEYWWDSVSAQEKQCYVDKYGAPPFYEP